MATPNEINSNFRQIAVADASGNVFGVNIANVGNIRIAGGTSGQVLSTDGTGNLSWATSSGGVGTTSYVNVSRTGTSQTVTAAPTTILWNSSVSGSIPYNATTGEFTLTAGVTYQLNSELQLEATGGTYLDYQWYNVTAGVGIGTKGSSESLSSASAFGTGQPAQAVITPSVTTVVSVRVVAKGASNGLVRFDYSFASINQIGTTAAAVTTAPSWSYGTWPSDFAAPAAGTVLKPTTMQTVGIPYDATTGLYTLTAGKTYRLEQQVVSSNSGGGAEIAMLWQTAAGTQIGTNSADGYGLVYPATTPLLVMYQPSVDTQVKAVLTYRGGAPNIVARFTHIAITEVGSTVGLPVGPTVTTATNTITGTTTNPTKATTTVLDYITIVDDKSGWCDVEMVYAHNTNAGAAPGSGTYLFTLPGGYQFDTAVQPVNTQIGNMNGTTEVHKSIPCSAMIQYSTTYGVNNTYVVPHSATQFKLMVMLPTQFTYINSSYYQIDALQITYSVRFRFKKA